MFGAVQALAEPKWITKKGLFSIMIASKNNPLKKYGKVVILDSW